MIGMRASAPDRLRVLEQIVMALARLGIEDIQASPPKAKTLAARCGA